MLNNEFENTKEKLLSEGSKILVHVEKYKTQPIFPQEIKYSDWKKKTINFFRKNNIKYYEAEFSEQDDFPKTEKEAFHFYWDNFMPKEDNPEIIDFIKSVKEQLRYLRAIDEGKTIIHVDIQKTMLYIKGTDYKYEIKKVGGKQSKRFTFIMKILESKKPIPAKKLGVVGKPLSIISKEKGEINKIFKKKLRCFIDLIVTDANGGYKLNSEKYNIKKT